MGMARCGRLAKRRSRLNLAQSKWRTRYKGPPRSRRRYTLGDDSCEYPIRSTTVPNKASMKLLPSGLRLSASDLANHLGCRHLTLLDRGVAEGRIDASKW